MVKLLNWKKGMPFKARGHSWLLELLLLVLELEKSCFSWSYKVKRTLDSCTFAHWAFRVMAALSQSGLQHAAYGWNLKLPHVPCTCVVYWAKLMEESVKNVPLGKS